jgi:hypothetical protein
MVVGVEEEVVVVEHPDVGVELGRAVRYPLLR